jgi:hypothetical protein
MTFGKRAVSPADNFVFLPSVSLRLCVNSLRQTCHLSLASFVGVIKNVRAIMSVLLISDIGNICV